MKNIFLRVWMFVLCAAAAAGATSCGSNGGTDDPVSGVSSQQWSETELISGGAGSKSYAFKALGAWTARTLSSWVRIETLSGGAGDAVLRLSVDENTTGAERSATITVNVDGYLSASFTLKQSGSTTAAEENEFLDKWMFGYMGSHYLWNEAVAKVTPDYTMDYQKFLQKVLADIAAQDDVNHDDGHWSVDAQGRPVRTSFYSNIQRYPLSKTTRGGTRETIDGFGIEYVAGGTFSNTGDCFFVVMAVAPGSPADEAGIGRGDYIVGIAGRSITQATFDNDWYLLMSATSDASVTFTPGVVTETGSLSEGDPVTLTRATYDDNPVYLVDTFTADNGEKVGYVWYNTFNMYYDQELIDAFAQLRAEGVRHLILDLRYNGGGHLVSSTVLGTLVAGSDHKGETYATTVYNAARTAAGEKAAIYSLGEKIIKYGASNGGDAAYAPIEEALSSSLGLSTVYVLGTTNTASASELVINGLRGVGVDVRLIGRQTNGKNVGMEPATVERGEWEYDFSPITFYSVNAQGFKDYSDGFAPDVDVDEFDVKYDIYPMGDERDPLIATALRWIDTGAKPAPAEAAARTRVAGDELVVLPRLPRRLDGTIAFPRE